MQMPFIAFIQDIMNNGKDFIFVDSMPEKAVKNTLRSAKIQFWGRQYFSNGGGWMITVPAKDAQRAYNALKEAGINPWYTPNNVKTDEIREPGCPLVVALLALGVASAGGLTWVMISLIA